MENRSPGFLPNLFVERTGAMELDFGKFKERYQKVPVEEYPNRVVDAVPDPVVTICVSTYQHSDFIHNCLDGVLIQETSFPFEVIIGEDESSDGTREICKQYAEKHPDKIRLFLHRRENNIEVHGRPTGKFQLVYSHFKARGEFIAICEGDDFWTDPSKIKKQVSFLDHNDEYALSYHDVKIIDEDGVIVEGSKKPDTQKGDISRESLMRGEFLPTLTLCYKNIFNTLPSEFMKVINEDKFIISILGGIGKGGYQEDIKPSMYREHKGGIWSSSKSCFKLRAHKRTYKCIYNYHKKGGRNDVTKYLKEKHISYSHRLCLCESWNRNYIIAILEYLFLLPKLYLCKKYRNIFLLLWGIVKNFYVNLVRNS